jgi:hypothetical protein
MVWSMVSEEIAREPVAAAAQKRRAFDSEGNLVVTSSCTLDYCW